MKPGKLSESISNGDEVSGSCALRFLGADLFSVADLRRLLTLLFCLVAGLNAAGAEEVEVPISKQGGVWTVEVTLNERVTVPFVIDSGASEIHLTPDIVMTLIRSGSIEEDDFLPGAEYVLADGSKVKSPRFRLRTVTVGGVTVEKVEAAIGSKVEGSLLLGQSFFEKLGGFSIDTKSEVLRLQRAPKHSGGEPLASAFIRLMGTLPSYVGYAINLTFREVSEFATEALTPHAYAIRQATDLIQQAESSKDPVSRFALANQASELFSAHGATNEQIGRSKYLMGRSWEERDNPRKALPYFKRAFELDTKSAEFKKAFQDCEIVVAYQDGQDALKRAEEAINQEDYDSAIRHCKIAQDNLDKAHAKAELARANALLGLAYMKRGDLESSRAFLAAAVELDPEESKYSEALQLVDKSIADKKQNESETWRNYLQDVYLDLDSVRDTSDGMTFKTKRYDPSQRNSSETTGFLYQKHRISEVDGEYYEQVSVYSWPNDEWLAWTTTGKLNRDQYVLIRFSMMELFHADGRDGWP